MAKAKKGKTKSEKPVKAPKPAKAPKAEKTHKLPKSVAGIDLPRDLREQGAKLLELTRHPLVADIVAAGLVALAGSVRKKSEGATPAPAPAAKEADAKPTTMDDLTKTASSLATLIAARAAEKITAKLNEGRSTAPEAPKAPEAAAAPAPEAPPAPPAKPARAVAPKKPAAPKPAAKKPAAKPAAAAKKPAAAKAAAKPRATRKTSDAAKPDTKDGGTA